MDERQGPNLVPAPELRASDMDRDRTITALNQAAVSGQLRPVDHDTRIDQALAAGTVGELVTLVHDLPVPCDQRGLPIEPIESQVDGRFGKVVRQIDAGSVSHVHAVARFGQVVLDLRGLTDDSRPILITADSFAGQVKVLLPRGARVIDQGTARFGNRKAGSTPTRSDRYVLER
jgi:hypothetical protein